MRSVKEVDGVTYITVGEIGRRIERTASVIKTWYQWAHLFPEKAAERPALPQTFSALDAKGTLFFREEDTPLLLAFRDAIQYGDMAMINQAKWGKRGEAGKQETEAAVTVESLTAHPTATLSSKEILKQIVENSMHIFYGQVANGRVQIENEASMQLQIGYIMRTLGELYQFSPEQTFTIRLETRFDHDTNLTKSNSRRAKIDIVLELTDADETESCAIELKYFQKAYGAEPNHRYSIFADISNLEQYIQSGRFSFGVFICGTDHLHYVQHGAYSAKAKDFDARHGSVYHAGTELIYHSDEGAKTTFPPITLQKDHRFAWTQTGNLYFMTHVIE
ncbi:hypothetical protein [Brevibacillus migulae]|uniref:hypothetical protein n=1 Tax=Brevibacillus migulae TaxID=1644114 RepID=UPI00106E513B|nr:hypothetical protein [Brevibacillus migulae]